MRLADEILLLLTDDDSGAMSVAEADLDRAVAAGVLADLETAGLAQLAEVDGPAPDGSGIDVSAGSVCLTPASNEELEDIVHLVAVGAYRGLQGRMLVDVLPILGRAVYPAVHRALADDGILERKTAGMSMRPTTTWVTVDDSAEREARSVLHHVIAGEDVTPEQRRHARLVVVLLETAGVLDAALAELDDEARAVAHHTEAPLDAPPVYSAVVRALGGDPTV